MEKRGTKVFVASFMYWCLYMLNYQVLSIQPLIKGMNEKINFVYCTISTQEATYYSSSPQSHSQLNMNNIRICYCNELSWVVPWVLLHLLLGLPSTVPKNSPTIPANNIYACHVELHVVVHPLIWVVVQTCPHVNLCARPRHFVQFRNQEFSRTMA